VLEGDDPVLEWGKGTWIRVLLDRLDGAERQDFEEACRTHLKAAYPPLPDGRTLYPFRRLFIVARF
jgi:trans-aconitate 2-methyltransferase